MSIYLDVHILHMVPLKCNVTFACTHQAASGTTLRVMVHILFVSVHPATNKMNTCKQDGCYAPLIGDTLITRNLATECDVTFQRYHIYIDLHTHTHTHTHTHAHTHTHTHTHTHIGYPHVV